MIKLRQTTRLAGGHVTFKISLTSENLTVLAQVSQTRGEKIYDLKLFFMLNWQWRKWTLKQRQKMKLKLIHFVETRLLANITV